MKLKPWQFIGIPFGLLAILFFTLPYLVHDSDWAKWGIAPFLILAVAYVMAPQINWWWYKRNPPPLDIKIQRFIDDYFSFYQKLSPELKQRFRERTALYLLGNEFIFYRCFSLLFKVIFFSIRKNRKIELINA